MSVSRALAGWTRLLGFAAALVVCTGVGAAPGAVASEPAPIPATKLEIDADATKARRHHYVFAHRALPRLFFKNSEGLWAVLQESGATAMRDYWVELGKDLPEEDEKLSPEGMAVERLSSFADREAWLLTLPAPRRMPEAVFVLLVKKGDRRDYLTFELTLDDSMEFTGSRAVLCGWNAQGSHLNYGLAGAPNRDTFLRLAEKHLSASTGN